MAQGLPAVFKRRAKAPKLRRIQHETPISECVFNSSTRSRKIVLRTFRWAVAV